MENSFAELSKTICFMIPSIAESMFSKDAKFDRIGLCIIIYLTVSYWFSGNVFAYSWKEIYDCMMFNGCWLYETAQCVVSKDLPRYLLGDERWKGQKGGRPGAYYTDQT